MFAWWGRTVYRFRYIVIGVMVTLCLGGGAYGLSLGKHVTQSGFYDDNSESAVSSVLADDVYGRDRLSHIVAMFNAPEGKKVNDPEWSAKIADELDQVQADFPDQILSWNGYLKDPTGDPTQNGNNAEDGTRTFVLIPLKGDNDDEILNNFKLIEPELRKVDDGNIQLAGLQPLASELTGTIAEDQLRAEILALPLVAVVLFFVFGGVIAAFLPAMVGGLSIAGALGIMRLMAEFGPVHYFAQPVVTLIGLGIAIDYGLFIVSRFREELAEGYDTEAAIRRTMMTSGRTVTFSAVLIVASLAGLLLFPQGFLKSLTYAGIASISFAALLSITVLPACLAVLGKNVDALGVRTLLRVPFLRNWKPSFWWISFVADKTQKTKTREEVEQGFWGKLINTVMKRPVLYAAPILIFMILLIVPLGKLALGGISEKYLPPDNPVRMAQEDFDRTYPTLRTETLTLVITGASEAQIAAITTEADAIDGFTSTWKERPVAANEDGTAGTKTRDDVTVLQNALTVRNDAPDLMKELRAIPAPKGVTIGVGGVPALEQDSIHSLFEKMPLMLVILISTTTILMFLAFGSLVLPIKAAVMSALTLGSTLGVLTWIFVDGHLSTYLNFTPTPLTAPVIGLIIAVIYGLSTDYEVFLVSRMVEARERGMSTQEAIRIGTATTGRLITAAALILVVVAGAFVFSDLVMMKYLAFGLITALVLDATIIRMFLVPAVMKLLGDDCWWAPRWMKRLQVKLGLGEIHLPDERKRPVVRENEDALVGAGVGPRKIAPHDPTHPNPEANPRGRAPVRSVAPSRPADAPSAVGTAKIPTRSSEPATTRFAAPGHTVTRPSGPVPAAAPPLPPAGSQPRLPRQGTPKPPPAGAPPAGAPPAGPPPAGPAQAGPPPQRPREDREIESWLGELRGGGQPPAAEPTSADATTAIPVQRPANGTGERPQNGASRPDRPAPNPPPGRAARGGGAASDPTRGMQVRPGQPNTADAEPTEKFSAQAPAEEPAPEQPPQRRRGGGVSAADLLRREGRL